MILNPKPQSLKSKSIKARHPGTKIQTNTSSCSNYARRPEEGRVVASSYTVAKNNLFWAQESGGTAFKRVSVVGLTRILVVMSS